MQKQRFSIEQDGFYGTYYPAPVQSDCVMIGLFGDDPNDFMAKMGAKWLYRQGVNVLAMSPAKKDYSHVNCPLERIGTAIAWLRTHGNRKFGIMGMSTAGMHSLAAASYYPDITLTFGLTASDYIWQGFRQGKRDGCHEWPIEGASTLSWQGKPLPYMPFVYQHPQYWQEIQKATKGSGDFIRSTTVFRDSEAAREHTEAEMIPIENIRGKLILIGADDDALWEAGKYVRRMDERLKSRPHQCAYEAVVYEYGTHFVLPESMLRIALPVGLKFVLGLMFRSAKEHPDACEETRRDIDRRLTQAIRDWKQAP